MVFCMMTYLFLFSTFSGNDTFCVLADKVALKVKNIITKGIYDVVKASWLIKCLDGKRFIPW